MDSTITKPCTKCGADKPLDEFVKHKGRKHDRGSWCLACQAHAYRVRGAMQRRMQRDGIPDDTEKCCKKCGDVKPVVDFCLGSGKYGRHDQCRECQGADTRAKKKSSDRNRQRITGFSPQDFDTAVNAQGNCCAICHAEFSLLPVGRVHADHDHLTGERRGILCALCNQLLGLANDSAVLLRRAAEYLENPPLRGVL